MYRVLQQHTEKANEENWADQLIQENMHAKHSCLYSVGQGNQVQSCKTCEAVLSPPLSTNITTIKLCAWAFSSLQLRGGAASEHV